MIGKRMRRYHSEEKKVSHVFQSQWGKKIVQSNEVKPNSECNYTSTVDALNDNVIIWLNGTIFTEVDQLSNNISLVYSDQATIHLKNNTLHLMVSLNNDFKNVTQEGHINNNFLVIKLSTLKPKIFVSLSHSINIINSSLSQTDYMKRNPVYYLPSTIVNLKYIT